METQPTGTASSLAKRDTSMLVVRSLLWALLAVLLLIAGWLWLQACGTYPILGFSRDYCPVPVDHTALEKEVAIGEALRRQVHQAELKVAEAPICPSPHDKQTVVTQEDKQKIKDRVAETHAKSGKLQITLTWETKDDLDLNLFCPGGKISSETTKRGPGICGDGTKDVDANREATDQATTTPVENIFFKDNVPAGKYAIEVIEYTAHVKGQPNSVPYKLRIQWNGEERFCSGVVTWKEDTSTEKDSEGVIGGYYQILSWTLADGLPACDFKTGTGHRGGSK